MSTESKKLRALADVLVLAATGYSLYHLVTFILRRLENLDPEKGDREDLARRSAAILRRLDENEEMNSSAVNGDGKENRDGLGRRQRMSLTPYEQKIITEVVMPEDIHVSFADIGGLDEIITELKESVIYPLTAPRLFIGQSSLLSAPKGVLLYGPPGCGKTMLAKALAKESGACFINLHISTLTEKWYGDSNKMVNAVFSLARKLQPAIIFIDEIDAVLRSRTSQDHEASAMVKAEFMTHWDGLLSANPNTGTQSQITVLGATNRIQDIDEAILRRLPKKFPIPLPDASQRRRILSLILKGTKLDLEFNMDALIQATSGFSGSDLKEACRDAAMVPMREFINKKREEAGGDLNKAVIDDISEVRGLRNSDFFRKGTSSYLSVINLDRRIIEDI